MQNLLSTIVGRALFSLTLVLVLGASSLSAKKGGNKPPPGDGGSCASLPTVGFDHIAEILNPDPTENGFFGVSVAAKENGGTILAAVVSKVPGRVHVFSIDSASAESLKTSIVLPGLEDDGTAARVEIVDVDGDAYWDLVVTHGGLEKGWVYLNDGTGAYPADPSVELDPAEDARWFGQRGLVLDNGMLYISAGLATVNDRGPRGAVFQCNPGTGACTRLGTPEDFDTPVSDYDVFGHGIALGDINGGGSPELLVSALGGGKGKNKGPARIFAYGLNGGVFDLTNPVATLNGASGFLHARQLDGINYDEIFAVSFDDGSGKVFVNPSTSRAFGAGDDFELGLVPELTAEYGTNSDVGSLAGGETVALVGGPGGCVNNNGFAYLYVFDDPSDPLASTTATAQSPTSDGADFGWDVATTGTDLVLISERAATVDGVSGAGKIHIYEYNP